MVERRADPADRRVWRLHLSSAATAELGEIARQRAEIVGLALARLDPELVRVMSDGLRQMKAALGNEPRTRERDAAKGVA